MNTTINNNLYAVPYLKIVRSVAFLLLLIFVGRVALVTVYGFAGVPKNNAARVQTETGEQDNDDKKEDNKYAEKQFKCFAPASYILPESSPLNTSLISFAPITAAVHDDRVKVVPTPPPNC